MNQGVSFFYVLSGFILQHSYRSRFGSKGGITPVQFIALRFFRLWPCHIAVILLLIVANGNWILSWFVENYTVGQILSTIFLLQAWYTDIKLVFAINSPAWSISVELFFYVMFPLLCQQALKSPLIPMYFCAAITIAWLTAIGLYMPSGNFATLTGTNPLARILEFSAGISAYEYYFGQPKRSFRSGTLLEIVTLALASLSVATMPIVANFVGTWLGMHLGWWLGSAGSFWTFAIVIVVFFRQKGRLSRYVGWKPMVYLGEISFALYLVHQPVINYLSRQEPWFYQLPLLMQVIVFAIIVLGLSSALHHLIEKPSMKIAKRIILNGVVEARHIPLLNVTAQEVSPIDSPKTEK